MPTRRWPGRRRDEFIRRDGHGRASFFSLCQWLEEPNATHRNTGLLVQVQTRVAVRLGGGTSAVGEVRGASGESRSSSAWASNPLSCHPTARSKNLARTVRRRFTGGGSRHIISRTGRNRAPGGIRWHSTTALVARGDAGAVAVAFMGSADMRHAITNVQIMETHEKRGGGKTARGMRGAFERCEVVVLRGWTKGGGKTIPSFVVSKTRVAGDG